MNLTEQKALLTTRQRDVFDFLLARGKSSSLAVAKFLNIDHSTACKHLDKMMSKGVVFATSAEPGPTGGLYREYYLHRGECEYECQHAKDIGEPQLHCVGQCYYSEGENEKTE